MRYYITVHNEGGQFNATAKAPADVSVVLKREGWQEVVVKKKQIKNTVDRISCLHDTLKLILRFRSEDELLIQFPFFLNRYLAFWLKLHLLCRPKLIVLIHDLDELRLENTKTDYSLIKQADKVIAHTEAMKDYLINKGVLSEKIYILHFFDYIVHKQRISVPQYGNSVAFAGNLMKSEFIKKIKELNVLNENIFFLYGVSCPDGIVCSNIHYMGKFSPDDISGLEGDWGLVWDGDDTETCSSTSVANVGNYLRYNASHKISLYLAAGMPLIIWKESGLAGYVEKHNLGITISSLREIPSAISGAKSKIPLIKSSVEFFSKKVRNGEMLKEATLSPCNNCSRTRN